MTTLFSELQRDISLFNILKDKGKSKEGLSSIESASGQFMVMKGELHKSSVHD